MQKAPELRRSSESSLLQRSKLRSFSGALEVAFATTQQALELRSLLLLQRRKVQSSGEAPKAPCCNAASPGAPKKLRKLLAATQQALELRRSSKSSLLQRSKLRSFFGACFYLQRRKLQKLLAATQQAPKLRNLLLLQRSFCCNGACCSVATSSKLLSFSRACLLGFSLLAKKKAVFFWGGAIEKKAFFFVFFVVEEKEEEP